ncbi:MAG TPA: hypothetical protein GXZ85_07950 [Firmicutes bacterium]|jgi:hypothetical protein|nr:hypothetical protein [Bacillota bacterium]
MVRKSLIIVIGLLVVLSLSSLACAQDVWAWNQFTKPYELFKYQITQYTSSWDYEVGEDVLKETRQLQTVELRQVDDETTEVTIANTYDVPTNRLSDELSVMGMGLGWAMGAAEWVGEFMILGLFGTELELEVGSSMQTFDGSRIRVVEKQTVAGVEGYFCTKSRREDDGSGNRVDILTTELVIAPDVGWPLLVRVYKDDQVRYIMELVEYASR